MRELCQQDMGDYKVIVTTYRSRGNCSWSSRLSLSHTVNSFDVVQLLRTL